MLDKESLHLLQEALQKLEEPYASLPSFTPAADAEALQAVLQETAGRMQDNFPFYHPLYVGQMLKPPHPMARLAYAMAQFVNPNNHALDGGRASSLMEKEAVAQLAAMLDWPQHLGHLTGGGTMANLEALWVASKLQPGKTVLASELAHYTHERISAVLGIPFEKIAVDKQGRLDLQALEARLQRGDVGTVVATLGTTGLGAVDPLDKLVALQQTWGFRLHADAAYGGYFRLAGNLEPEVARAFATLSQADSVVIDPHKHGLQPYGCGCVLFRDPAVGRFYRHDSPYTYFTSEELHLGEISLECSRPGAAAVALWATQRLLPLEQGGAFAQDLEKCRQAALQCWDQLQQSPHWMPLLPPALDIVVYAPRAADTDTISRLSQQIFTAAAKKDLHLAQFRYPTRLLPTSWQGVEIRGEWVTCLRSCFMKPEHVEWLPEIWSRLEASREEVAGPQA
ncbi:pyridoxal phosphate-dependent decarboxylase family protein [Cesiribacter andamanensis]|uniref:L-2,4-diaminobutyrate decarboxylase n=1 Tax=Cesiribacter andamanensis AMV16 TaxID=1279009 RepID=M7NJH1_9BACT|nr:aminotransferase class I/II-fold pyridoxal phosphate-dependent enzyme [Cesiribacter andamanensis]EMR01945.1 L-2,4-diaminobutyrate decarboxylase [Cesiribacter andamanensis AMV16]